LTSEFRRERIFLAPPIVFTSAAAAGSDSFPAAPLGLSRIPIAYETSLLFGVMLAVLGAAIVSTSAQTQSTTIQVSKLVGTKVKSSQGDEVGVIKDVVIDRNSGCMSYTVLSTGEGGARTAGGGKLVAVPWAVYSPTSDVICGVSSLSFDRSCIRR
jgi:sporulation protein YlmC with PRC-barrel domain